MRATFKALLIAVAVLVVLGASFLALNAYIYQEKQSATEVTSYRGTLSGQYTCVPQTGTSSAPTTECVPSIRTEAGDYVLDFGAMPQTPPELSEGEYFSASGLITPIEMLSSEQWRNYPAKGIFSVTDSVKKETYACNADARLCPDGSSVGRTGPKCEFAPCPSPERTSATLTTYLGGSPTALNVTVNPKKIVSDSRCPQGVQCIWAGTVEVRTVLSTQVSHGEHTLKLGEPQQFGDYTVTLVEVKPGKTQEEIPESSYRFTFEIKKQPSAL